jgi:hypothetical protein
MKIKFITNYLSDELYSISKEFYKDFGFEMIGVNGKNRFYGFPFFNYMMTDKLFADCDWAIYVDEDCFITNKNALLDLLNYQINNDIHCSGVPDGGVISHRFHNPISIIAFFMIIKIGELRKTYNYNNANSMKYDHDLDKFIPHHIINSNRSYHEKFSRTIAKGYSPYGIIYDNFEPTYKLFFWLLRNGYKMQYLNAYDYSDDDLTTVVKNHNDVDFAYHTWFARNWNDTPSQNKRIRKIIDYCNTIKNK